MGFKTDGSVHIDGIANEQHLKTKLSNGLAKEIYPDLEDKFHVEQKGGTKFKQDLEVSDSKMIRKLSAKRKKGINNGSFDYVNSSAAVKQYEVFNSITNTVKNLRSNPLSVSETRKLFNEASNKTMKNITSQQLSNILKEHVNQKNKDITVVITDSLTNTDYVYHFKDTPLYKAIRDFTPSFKWGRGKTSASIVFHDSDGNEYDLGLRGRLVLNNGVNALLGLSNSNASSQPVFKVQQDSVQKMLSEISKLQAFTDYKIEDNNG